MTKLAFGATAGAACVIASLLLPISVPSSLDVPARVAPAREWFLIGGAGADRIAAVLRDNSTGQVRQLDVHIFERGDDVNLELAAGLTSGAYVAAGDTLARLHSSELDEQLVSLQTELATAHALQQLKASGQKEAIVAVAREQLAASEERTRQQEARLERLRSLQAAGLASVEAMEEAENRVALDVIQEEVARAELQAALTGAAPSDVALTQTLIEGLGGERDLLEQRRATRVLVAPFAGRIAGMQSADTLLALHQDRDWVAHLLIDIRDHHKLATGQSVTLTLPGRDAAIPGSIQRLGSRPYVAAGRQTFVALARLQPGEPLVPSLVGRAIIRLPNVSLRQCLLDFISN